MTRRSRRLRRLVPIVILPALLLTGCLAPEPVRPGSPPALTTNRPPTDTAVNRPERFTALEAVGRADAALATRGRETWLITAEARPEPVGGRLGAAREWVLLYRQIDGPLLKVIVPVDGEISHSALPGGNWEGGRQDRFRIDPAEVAHDSTWAIRLADAAGGSRFLDEHPGSRRLVVLDHQSGDGLTWTVDYQSSDLYWMYTVIVEDATGRILHEAACEYTPAAMRDSFFPVCTRDSQAKRPPFVPLIPPSPHWDAI